MRRRLRDASRRLSRWIQRQLRHGGNLVARFKDLQPPYSNQELWSTMNRTDYRRRLSPFVYASTPDVNSLATDKPFLKWRSNRIIHGGSLFALAIPQPVPFLEYFPFRRTEGPSTGSASTLELRETLLFYGECFRQLSHVHGCLGNMHRLTYIKGRLS